MASRRVVWWLLGLAASAGAAPATAPATASPTRPEPKVQRTVIEDDHVKIEELRVRGQLQRITISPKASGVRPYEIAPPDSGRDPSQQSKGISGHSLWQLFSF
ncbi:MAG TPA: DUF2782 domain-containing protein [Burkholderiaceae bacterium]|nr:DUF2782 domain-containing protein [Burkholderiaceae bacterium]